VTLPTASSNWRQDANPAGTAGEGEYVEADRTITLTKYNGRALTRERSKWFSRKLNDGDDARIIAKRLTREYAFSLSDRPFFRTN